MTPGSLVDHCDIVRRRLIVLDPTSIHKVKLAAVHQFSHPVSHVVVLLVPPPAEKGLQNRVQTSAHPTCHDSLSWQFRVPVSVRPTVMTH